MKRLSDELQTILDDLKDAFKAAKEDMMRKQIDEVTGGDIERPNYRAISAMKELTRVITPLVDEIHELRKDEGTVGEGEERYALLKKYSDMIYETQKQVIAERGSRQVDSGEDNESGEKDTEARKKDGKDSRVRAEARE